MGFKERKILKFNLLKIFHFLGRYCEEGLETGVTN
jgi:hypothetical protein